MRRASAFILGSLLVSLAASSDAFACRQCQNWCDCIDACQDEYWNCREMYEGDVCIPLLDYCQRRCTCKAPTKDPVVVNLERVPGGVRWYVPPDPLDPSQTPNVLVPKLEPAEGAADEMNCRT